MGKNRKLVSLIAAALVVSFLLSLGVLSFADNPDKNNQPSTREEKMTKALESLVEKGVLKSEDVDKIMEYLRNHREEKKKMIEKMKEMDRDQRREFVKNYYRDKMNIWDKMVKDNVITEQQAEEIKKVIPYHKNKCKEYKKDQRIQQQ